MLTLGPTPDFFAEMISTTLGELHTGIEELLNAANIEKKIRETHNF